MRAFALSLLALASVAHAEPPRLALGLAGLGFLLGHWSDGKGVVADTGGTSTGVSEITAEAGGAVLLRRDHTSLYDRSGKPAGGFDQIMMIYPENGALHADYSDGAHVIHYTSAEVQEGRSVTFSSPPQAGAPAYRLTYERSDPDTLKVSFSMAPPGTKVFRPIATGALSRTR